MSNLFLTTSVAGQPSSILTTATTSSIGYGTNGALTINSSAGVTFCSSGGTPLGASITTDGILNCKGLTINGPLTCTSLIAPNAMIFNGLLTCNSGLTCNGTLNLTSNMTNINISNAGNTILQLAVFNNNASYLDFVGSLQIRPNSASSSIGTPQRTYTFNSTGIDMNDGKITSCGRIACSSIGSSTGTIVAAISGNWYSIIAHAGTGPAIVSIIAGSDYWFGFVSGVYNAYSFFATPIAKSTNMSLIITGNTIGIMQGSGSTKIMCWTIQYLASADYTGGGNF